MTDAVLGDSRAALPPRRDLPELCTRGAALTRKVWAATRAAARGVRWYVTTLMGDSAYATYLAHQRRTHPEAAPLTEREFWRQKMDDQDRNPGARCC
jgi:uncharacterized short protein YbdD (DUF466 family)